MGASTGVPWAGTHDVVTDELMHNQLLSKSFSHCE